MLEWGQKSPRAASFDINWELLPHRQSGGVLLPVLGSPYGDALTGGEIELKYEPAEGSFSGLVFRSSISHQPATLQRHHQDRRVDGDAADAPAGHAMLALANEHRGRARHPTRRRRR